jgi:hypothetical protein
MPYDSATGTYQIPDGPLRPAVTNGLVRATDWEAFRRDLEAFLSTLLSVDGTGSIGLWSNSVKLAELVVSGGLLQIRQENDAGGATIELSPITAATAVAVVRAFAETDTTGLKSFELCLGDGTTGIETAFQAGSTAKNYIAASGGKLAVGKGTPAYTLDVGTTDALGLPSGTTVQRPVPREGLFRYNSSLGQIEAYHGGSWRVVPFQATASFSTAYWWKDPTTGFLKQGGLQAGGLVADNPMTVTFPIAFPAACRSLTATPLVTLGVPRVVSLTAPPSVTSFEIIRASLDSAATNTAFYWQAEGN